jgi:hypothetical protein
LFQNALVWKVKHVSQQSSKSANASPLRKIQIQGLALVSQLFLSVFHDHPYDFDDDFMREQ